MTNLISTVETIVKSGTYGIITTLIILIVVLLSMYNKIKYKCLEKALEKIADIEQNTELTGEEKFKIVVQWVNSDLPIIYKTTLLQQLIEKLVKYAYDNSKEYMENHVKRITGMDVQEVVNMSTSNLQDSSDET